MGPRNAAVFFIPVYLGNFHSVLRSRSRPDALASQATQLTTSRVPETVYAEHTAALPLPWAGPLQVSWIVTRELHWRSWNLPLHGLLLYRRITVIARLSTLLWFGVMGTIGWIIFAGLTILTPHSRSISLPARLRSRPAFSLDSGAPCSSPPTIIGAITTSATLAMRLRTPRGYPRALLLSILIVACLYILMNLCILGSGAVAEMLQAGQNNNGLYVVSLFMQKIYGPWAARLVSGIGDRNRFCISFFADPRVFPRPLCSRSGWELF